MKRTLVLASLLLSTAALADTKTIGIDGGIAVPTGDWGDAVGFGIGALARFEMPIKDKLFFAARAGYIQHLEKEDSNTTVSEIPLFAGVRYMFTPTIYGVGELGFVNYRFSVDVGGESMSDSETNLGMTLGAGYRSGKLDIRGGLFFPDVDKADDAMAVMATVGYDISSL
jgi:Outer membrane protein beta-barrel domain